jgi:epoxyqueuosine reductase
MNYATLDTGALKVEIARIARALGAGEVRIAPAFADDASRARMIAAFERGDFETWRYGDAYARSATDPRELLTGARTVICIAWPYATPGPDERVPLSGRVSNYAWSSDYHRRVRRLLDVMARAIDEAAGEPVTAVACDTRPLAERAFAARAGLGWIGKHTNLISPKQGSFVFLGEIVTSLELPVDEPLRKSCGSCTRCVEVCPTRALRGDYTIDASRCISDLTQRTDAIPRELRPLIGTWVWGCDLCQLACPPTQLAGTSGESGLGNEPMHEQTAVPSLVRLLRLRSGEFKRTYGKTAMGWRGAAVLRRNAAVALGNSLDRAAVSDLAAALREDPHPLVRGHAAWALGRIASPSALYALREHSGVEQDPSVLAEMRDALEPFRGGALC